MKYVEIALKKPFANHKWRKGYKGGKDLVYIDARDVMNRLDEVLGVGGWQAHYDSVGGRMICKLACKIEGQWVTKSDGAGDTDIEGNKGGISDALKRAGVLWGIGRYLYYPSAFDSNRQPAECAPPDLLRQTINGRLSLRILCMRLVWSKLYSSISIHPQRQSLFSVIGIIPRAAPFPSRWSDHKESVTSPLTIKALPFCFPFSPRSPG